MSSPTAQDDVESQGEGSPREKGIRPPIARGDEDNKDAGYGDTSTHIWKLYGVESEKYDMALVNSWKASADSMLIFTGLFSAIVATFLVETYKTLQPDTGTQTVAILAQLATRADGAAIPVASLDQALQFTKPTSAIRVNILMFLSLFLSVTSALVSTLIQQWARDYLQYSQPSAAPHKRGRVRAYLFEGLLQFQMRRLVYGVPVLLHVSVFLFFFALSDFLHSVDGLVGRVARYSFVGLLAAYLALSLFPLIVKNSPYQTALTTPLQACLSIIRSSFRLLLRPFHRSPKGRVSGIWKDSSLLRSIHVDRARVLMKETKRRASTLDRSAMHWLLQELDDDNMDVFLKGLPGYIHSPVTDTKMLIEGLAADGFLWRIREHFTTCVVSPELGEDERMSRAVACADSLQMISETAVSLQLTPEISAVSVSPGPGLEGSDIETIMKHLVPFCGSPDPTVALRASCVMGLAIQGFLASLARSDPQDTDVRTFPGYLLPLYYTIQSWKTSDVSRWSYVSIIPASTIHPPPSDQEMWSDLLYDAPLINLAVLANAVLSRSSAQEVHLTMPWKTLEALLKAFDIVQVRASPETQSRFHDVHGRVRSSINRHEGGRIIVPLLDTLDIVARGLRLSEVFASVPGTRLLRSQVEILFGRDQLRNHDLLEAFVSHLPGYIASTPPDVSRALMERIVNEDQLWEKLHVNLSKCFLPTIPFSEKMRIVKMFHDLLDELFVLLEGSPNIDWHAPEFDLLIGHLSRYDREVARGMLVDRSLVFRDDFFTAQFCHASLAQFAVLASRGDPLTMYSIGSLIRIFVDLEAGEEEEVRFWGSRRSQGVNGPELRMKAEKMVISLLRNGPLSNFYRLGMLSFDMVQDETGDSVSENVKKTWKLLEKIIDSTLMPMGGASPRLWFHFDHFRDTVRNAATVASARGVKHLLPLLEMVNRVDALPRAATDDVQSTDDSSEDGGKPPSSEWEDLPGDPRRRPDGPPRPAPYNRRMHPHKGRHRPPRGVRFDDGPMPPMMGYPPPGPGGPWDNSGPNPMEWSHGMPPGVPPDMPPMSGPPPHPPFPPPRRQSTSRFGSLDFVPPYTERFDGGHDRMYPVGPGGPAVGPHDYMNSMDPGGSGSNMPPMLPPPRPGPSHHPGNPFFPPRRRYSGFSESPPPLNRNRSSPAPAPAPAVDYTTPDAMYPNDGGGNDEWRAHQ